jgi:hypothetical protein
MVDAVAGRSFPPRRGLPDDTGCAAADAMLYDEDRRETITGSEEGCDADTRCRWLIELVVQKAIRRQ